jgi:hypothetical protein
MARRSPVPVVLALAGWIEKVAYAYRARQAHGMENIGRRPNIDCTTRQLPIRTSCIQLGRPLAPRERDTSRATGAARHPPNALGVRVARATTAAANNTCIGRG